MSLPPSDGDYPSTRPICKQKRWRYFIATLITDLILDYDLPEKADYCGTCTRCIDACPTSAIGSDKNVDGSRCISYFTIELKDLVIPDKMKNSFADWMFGCDICQDVCPWNRFAQPSAEPAFQALEEILHFSSQDWEELSEENFKRIFSDSPLKRAKFAGIKRNLEFIRKK